ncbi:MAG: hypothetical protein M0P69_22175, partial [Bacteroidales bacterium]|nr:hypothetical protein [Bacteroidales bacterium]
MSGADKTKLNGIAPGAEVNVNADWNSVSGDSQILNKPVLATVATSGSYTDLSNKPTIPAALDGLSGTLDDIVDGTTYVKSTNDYTDDEKSKLSGIELGATGDQTPNEILTAIKTVDGAGSGLDADTLDGNHAAAFAEASHSHSASEVTDFDTEVGNHTDVAANTADRHSHSNKATLDEVTAAFTTDLNSKLVGIEASADVTDATNVAAAGAVMNSGDQTVNGVKTFGSIPVIPTTTPTTDGQVASKKYVDDSVGVGGIVSSVNGETGAVVLTQDDVGDGTTYKRYSQTEKTKLFGIAEGAEVNVQSDWDAVSGDAQILNKPEVGELDGTLVDGQLSKVAGTYTVDPLAPVTNAVHSQLSTPSIMEVAASNMFLENKLLLVVPDVVKYSDDNGANWYDTTWTANQIADLMLGRYSNSYCTIDRSWTNVKFEWTASVVGMGYFTLNFLYLYTSTRGNTMKVLIEKQDNDTSVWSTVAETAYFSSWPAHQWIPHDSIAFDDNTTHYKAVRLTFTPSWDSATEAIRIHQIDWWGAYPANYQNRLWSWDRDGLITINEGLYVSGNVTLSGTVDGRDIATDGSKLDGIEAAADVTDATNVAAAGAVMTSGDQTVNGVKTFGSFPVTPSSAPTSDYQVANKKYVDDNAGTGTGAVNSVNGYTGVVVLDADDIADGTTNKAYTSTEQAKLSGIEGGATNIADYRNTATTNGVAGIYNPCKTLVDEHIPSCVVHYEFFGSVLDGSYNPDSWYPINGNGSVSYNSRVLSYSTLTGVSASARTVIDQETFSMSRNYLSFTVKIDSMATGAGGTRNTAIGFQP